jgi:hypothetical protein
MNLRLNFLIKGYVVLPGVFNAEEVKILRGRLSEKFQEYYEKNIFKRCLLPSESLNFKEIYAIPFREKIVKALKELLGDDYSMFSDLTVDRNCFGYNAWHTDANSEGDQPYLYEKNYKFVKCGVYLQSNSFEWGGGIDLVTGGHLFGRTFPFNLFNLEIRRKFNSLYNQIGKKYFAGRAEIGPGDVVIFDSRLWHKSSTPHNILQNGEIKTLNNFIADIPEDKTKFVIYWDCCNSASAEGFLNNNLGRANEEILNYKDEFLFADYLSKIFPDDYPADFVSSVKNNKIRVAGLEKEKALELKNKFQSVTGSNYR